MMRKHFNQCMDSMWSFYKHKFHKFSHIIHTGPSNHCLRSHVSFCIFSVSCCNYFTSFVCLFFTSCNFSFLSSRVFLFQDIASFLFALLAFSVTLHPSPLPLLLFILQPSTDLFVLSLVFSSCGGLLSWEGQLIYPPKKGTNSSDTGLCIGRLCILASACSL